MTEGGRFISVFGALCVGLCLVLSVYMVVQELMARAALPPEMRTPEMIQKHFDGEVQLLSLTMAYGFFLLGGVLAVAFLIIWAFHEWAAGRR